MSSFTRKQAEYVQSVLLYDFSNVASRIRRIFNYHCWQLNCLYDWRHYQDVQKIFDKIDSEATCRWTHGEPFSCFFDEEEIGYRYVYQKPFKSVDFKPLNNHLFKLTIHTTWLQTRFIRFDAPITAFAEALDTVWVDAQNIAAAYKTLVGPEHADFRPINEMPQHFDNLIKFFIDV